jgi:uncharacterized repeat protein (TIGR03803 family)
LFSACLLSFLVLQCRAETEGRLLHSFSVAIAVGANYTNSDGANPVGRPVLIGINLYGTTTSGGILGKGTLFRVSTDGSRFTNMHNFGIGLDGAVPQAGLTVFGNKLYGTTSEGAANNTGGLYSINPDGTGYTNFYTFTAITSSSVSSNRDGAYPSAGLVVAGDTVYGTAVSGGNYGAGTIFSVGTNGANFAVVHRVTPYDMDAFTNLEGVYPQSGVILSNDTLYGVAPYGGGTNRGTVFALKLPSPPVLNIALANTNVLVSWPVAAVGYQLQSATDLVSGNWIDITDPLSVADTNFVFTGSATDPQNFFRLQR